MIRVRFSSSVSGAANNGCLSFTVNPSAHSEAVSPPVTRCSQRGVENRLPRTAPYAVRGFFSACATPALPRALLVIRGAAAVRGEGQQSPPPAPPRHVKGRRCERKANHAQTEICPRLVFARQKAFARGGR